MLSPRADLTEVSRADGGADVHLGRLVSLPHAVQAAIVARVAAFESIEDDFHPDPAVSPSSSRRLATAAAPELPKIPPRSAWEHKRLVRRARDTSERPRLARIELAFRGFLGTAGSKAPRTCPTTGRKRVPEHSRRGYL